MDPFVHGGFLSFSSFHVQDLYEGFDSDTLETDCSYQTALYDRVVYILEIRFPGRDIKLLRKICGG